MSQIKLTKNELRTQQIKLAQLQKYLPTLQLKKAMLQSEVHEANLEISLLKNEMNDRRLDVEQWAELLSSKTSLKPTEVTKISRIQRRFENIAGVEVPYFESASFEELNYSLFDTPVWTDSAVIGLRAITTASVKIKVAQEKKAALEKELREVSIRVNLFEKILIPRSLDNIRKIKVFLADQQLAAVSQAKAAKKKIEKNKLQRRMNLNAC